MRYLITVSYDGTLFAGYQKQPKQRTVKGRTVKGNRGTSCKDFRAGFIMLIRH